MPHSIARMRSIAVRVTLNLVRMKSLMAVVFTVASIAIAAPAAQAAPPGSVHADATEELPGVTATTISYASTLMNGSPTTVTGMVLEPKAPWNGPGERPTVVYAPGTRGAGDHCAPSRVRAGTDGSRFDQGYEAAAGSVYEYATTQGVRVVVTDYIGLGTPGHHSYVNNVEEAHAVLDAARAGLKLAGAPASAPVGFAGYSQGGGAAAAAGEYAATYAPELNVKGSFAGAPPADLFEVMNAVDGSALVHVLGYAINGFAARSTAFSHEIIDELNPRGREFLTDAETFCIRESMSTWGNIRTSELTESGETFAELLRRKPAASRMMREQRLGQHALNAPMLVMNSPTDDIIPYQQARTMARDFCAAGGTVQFENARAVNVRPGSGTNHAAPMVRSLLHGTNYLIDRFRDVPAPSNCQVS